MDRRASLKSLLLGTVAGGLAVHGCTPREASEAAEQLIQEAGFGYGRTPEETEQIQKLQAEPYFNPHELQTIAVLANLILPPNEEFGGPLEAEVPEFIEFMAKDIPELEGYIKSIPS